MQLPRLAPSFASVVLATALTAACRTEVTSTSTTPQTVATADAGMPAPSRGALGAAAEQPAGVFASLSGSGDLAGGFGHRDDAGVPRLARPATVTHVSLGPAEVRGQLDPGLVHDHLRRRLPRLDYCYSKELLGRPALAGTVTATFTIGPDGKVVTARADGVDVALAECVAAVVREVEFPTPRDGRPVQVAYPMTFDTSAGSP